MKKILFICLGIAINHLTFAQGLTQNGQITTAGSTYVNTNGTIGSTTGVNKNGQIVLAAIPHAVGDSYQGGTIFYILQSGDPNYDANVQHGFIAAPSDQSTSAVWGCNSTQIGAAAQSLALGAGKANTTAITAGCTTTGIAAQLCTSLNTGGYTDWYLPSANELQQLYNNRAYVSTLNTGVAYWSSTEYSDGHAFDAANNAYYFIFPSGSSTLAGKANNAYVRAIRSF